MSKEMNSSSNDQDTTENEIRNITVSNNSSGLDNLKESNTTVESNTIRSLYSPIINWENDTTGLEACNFNKIRDVCLRYKYGWNNGRRYLWRSNFYEQEKQITEIIRHLAYNNSYRVHGFWVCHQWQCGHRPPQCKTVESCKRQVPYRGCRHKPQCQNESECRREFNIRQWQREHLCQREWLKQYDQDLLKQYFEVITRAPPYSAYSAYSAYWLGLFVRICDKHKDDRGNLISSFLLYNSKNSDTKPALEIIRHLVWRNKYRVFGNWKCSRCEKRWKSAYTWISLQKYIEKTPGKRLKKKNDDYVIQKCKEEECGGDGIILSYKALVLSEDHIKHKSSLCAKCLAKEFCSESGIYYGK